MQIGKEFNKIEFEAFGLDLLEPNAFIGDTLICIVAFYLAYKISKGKKDFFTQQWVSFYCLFAITFFFGGLGHLFYNYWSIEGKLPSWILGMVAVFFVERAMISLMKSERAKRVLNVISFIKLVSAVTGVLVVYFFVDLKADYTKGMLVPSINSAVGLIFSLSYLGYIYTKRLHPSFAYFVFGVLTLVPAAIFQQMKIDIHQWFDRNDVGHLFLIIGISLYYRGVKGYQQMINEQP